MDKILDLRFVIGVFFTLVALLLLAYAFLSAAPIGNINFWCGVLFLIFGVLMIVLSFRKDAHDDLTIRKDQ